jgi:hypothetical protein
MPTWFQARHLEHAQTLLADVRALAPLTHAQSVEYVQSRGHDEIEARRIVQAVRRHAHLLHNAESALWTTAPRVVYQAYPEPEELDGEAARAWLLRRYLRAFGPSSKADVADWSGLRVRDFEAALDGLPTIRDEDGRTLYAVPRAPLPAADTPAPVRFLPRWDNTLLGHADRRRVITDELRKGVVAKNGIVEASVLVDGFVAGTWTGKAEVELLVPLTRTQRAEVADEAARLAAWLP